MRVAVKSFNLLDENRERVRLKMTEESFKADLKAFHDSFSIDQYLELRSKYPDRYVPIYRFAGVDQIFYLDGELKRFGIDGLLLSAVLDGEPEAIDRLCLILIKQLKAAQDLESKGEVHVFSSGKFVNKSTMSMLACFCFEAMDWHRTPLLVSSLHYLMQLLLIGQNSAFSKEFEHSALKSRAVQVGAQIALYGRKPTYRAVAEVLGCAHTSISRCFESVEEYQAEIEHRKRVFEAMPRFKRLHDTDHEEND